MLPFSRTFSKPRRNQPVAHMSIMCRGKPISREGLFKYTSGRFLVNEDDQFARRYRPFNLDALCDVAATAGGNTSRIAAIEKFEGGFSKALLMTKEDGSELIAKIPFGIAGPACLTTASEVGTLEYIRRYTSVPVPRVFSWSTDESNPVGAEYIIMEKAPGEQLFERWDEQKSKKLELIVHLTQLEAQLSAIPFPAYGGLYLRANAHRLRHHDLDGSLDEQQSFCIGPSPDRFFGVGAVAGISSKGDSRDNGPWNSLSAYGVAIAKRELSKISRRSLDNQPTAHQETPEEQARLLEITTTVMKMLDSHPVSQFSQPTLWHTDLQMGNIFVAPDNSTKITSLIDIQSLSVLPLFLQARWPRFLDPPRDYTRGPIPPKLPDDFDSLDEDDKALARLKYEQTLLAKAYEIRTALDNKPAHGAMAAEPRVFRDLFTRAGEASTTGTTPLRESLLEISRHWSDLGFSGDCPYSFSAEEVAAHERDFAAYEERRDLRRFAMEALSTDEDGWIAPQVDFERVRALNKELLETCIARWEGVSEEEVRRMWPFPAE
ncbi:kinase-like domain-containing protein [Aspergillus carlsbadensis]|nr:kinase-like domain-containing protein [Aspergillus carlsbadensis]